MKKTAFFGMVILIVLFLGTCGMGQGGTSNTGIEYTDVVYSYAADGRPQVKLFFDGKGVPVSQQQRALTTDIAKMSHDFYEVVFWDTSGSGTVARASWEIGQSAGIRGVSKAGGVQYASARTALPASGSAAAVIFVGKNQGKTLFGIGELTEVINSDGSTSAGNNTISEKTISITFTVSAIETRLKPTLTANPTLPVSDIDEITSFLPSSFTGKDTPVADGISFPYYSLTVGTAPITSTADYIFFYNTNFTGGTAAFNVLSHAGIRVINTGTGMTNPEPIKRWPRYMSGGMYVYINDQINFGTKVSFSPPPPAGPFSGVVPLTFTSTDDDNTKGVFSFVFRIPVYAMTQLTSNNASPGNVNYEAVTWWLMPGFSTNLYALDNGKDAGGCVFVGRGVDPDQVINIETAGMPWGSM